MIKQQQSVEQLFGAALDLPPNQRQAFLERACREAPELRQLVEELLSEDERAGSFLASPLIGCAHSPSSAATCTSPSDPQHAGPASPVGPPRFLPSHVIADRFVVIRFIARGGMGEVYEVADRLLQHTHIALKVIRPEIAADAGSSHRFEQEVLLARSVRHPNLCPIYELFRCLEPAPPFLFLTMKLLHGDTLDTRLRGVRIPREDALEIGRGMIQGLAAIHAAGIIHRDIKPTNVMLERSGQQLCASIMDFGLARLHESESTIVQSGTIAGTPGYLAPELLQGHRPTQATDIFALGIVLHQVLTGARPAEAPNGLSVTPLPSLDTADAPSALIQSVKIFLADDPEQRCIAFEKIQAVPAAPGALSLSIPPAQPRLLNRRSFLLSGSSAACALAGAAFWKRDAIYDQFHPLPIKRFVALLDWPPPSDARIRPMLLGLIDAMANELARAEAFDHNFFVTAQTHTADLKSPAELNEVRESLGANLVLAASGLATPKYLSVDLHVLDPTSGRTLRSKELRVPHDQQFALPERVVRAAAQLLNVAHYDPNDERSRTGTDNPEALQAFQAAEALMKQPNDTGLETAIDKYKEAVEADRHYAIAHARLALAYLRLYVTRLDPSSVTLARANAETAISLEPKLAEAHVALASVYQDTAALPEALHEMGIALSLDPFDTRTMTYQAQIYTAMNRWKEAEEAYKRVLKLRPNYWLPYLELGNNYNAQADYISALTAYRAAAAAAPNRAIIHNNIGSVYFQLGKFSEALAAVDQGIALSPDSGYYQTRADILRAQGNYQEALRSALQATKLNPEESRAWLGVGDAYALFPQRTRERKEAYRHAKEAEERHLQTEPGNGPGWMLLALYRIKVGEDSTALNLVSKAESLGAADMESQLIKVRVLELLGRHDDALSAIRAAMLQGVTIHQVKAIHDLDPLRTDPRFST